MRHIAPHRLVLTLLLAYGRERPTKSALMRVYCQVLARYLVMARLRESCAYNPTQRPRGVSCRKFSPGRLSTIAFAG